jgi:hypothetical protein
MVSVARDPFRGDTPQQAPNELHSSSSSAIVGMHVVQSTPMGIVAPGAAEIRAIVSGVSPRALVDEGGHVRVVGPGDALAGSKIRRIDGSGVLLESGVLLKLVEREE